MSLGLVASLSVAGVRKISPSEVPLLQRHHNDRTADLGKSFGGAPPAVGSQRLFDARRRLQPPRITAKRLPPRGPAHLSRRGETLPDPRIDSSALFRPRAAMNTAILQGTIMATSHGISRINRHASRPPESYRTRISNVLKTKEQISRKSSLPRCSDEVQMEERVLSESTISTVDESLFSKAKSHASPRSDDFLRVNIGGSHFTVRKETIARRKTGRLSWLLNVAHTQRMPLVDGYFESSDEYYFERSPVLFHIVYQFYLTGCIHQPNHVCPQDLLDELEYWGIAPLDHLAPCCCADDEEDEDVVKEEEEVEAAPPNPFKHLKFGEFRRKVWTLIEEPTSSIYSQIFASFSILFVLVSISGLVLGSIPEFQMPVFKKNPADNASLQVVEMEPHPALSHIEHLCIVWFSLEYFSKMIVSADRKRTFLQLLNIIDLLAILPFIMEMALMVVGINTEQLRDLKGAFLVIRILRVLRVIRVLKLGRYSSGLQMFGKTLQASFRQLGMMAMVVLTGVIFFSTLVYFLEKDEPGSQFHSIPAACWWCIVTMTTVGYGDLTPVTVPGKLVATGAIACGVLVLALPITIIVDNFMKVAEGERRPNDSVGGIRRLGPRARITVGDNVEAVVSPPRPLNRRRLRQSTSFSSTAPLNSSGTVSSGNNGRIALAEKDADC
ncbi:hypothetical protein QR680_013210 [Steinernema hermaphroditum]|uniref:BTB domain-containing protein n=1 Tax=Steinernema hermaphroditum TaxID=289476 RepID=A0AA39I4Q6_9BILA|nr:hypothetical protein QR680_013210 [Steinernema hermaphroditum]